MTSSDRPGTGRRLAASALAACLPACGAPEPGAPVLPSSTTTTSLTTTTTTMLTPATTTTTTTTTTAPSADRALRDLVDGVLADYAKALTAVAIDPTEAARPGTPTRLAWDLIVMPDSWLSHDMLDTFTRRQVEDRVVVVPPQSGPSYRHYPLTVEPPRDGSISFTWCGWSPGIGLDVDTREVVDDGVAHAHGTGSLRSVGGRWMLESLDEWDLDALPAGSADPCAAELADAQASR